MKLHIFEAKIFIIVINIYSIFVHKHFPDKYNLKIFIINICQMYIGKNISIKNYISTSIKLVESSLS